MRIAIAVVGIAVCLFLIQATARIGFSRLLAKYAVVANSIPAADQAVRLSPSDPENHRARAVVSSRLQLPAEAVKSLESAASLRYRDDYLWLELGNAREESGDREAALAAFDQAIRWAPYYAHTHWQRGNVLLRMGRTAEAFAELRSAAAANRNYLPNLIDLAWGVSAGDIRATESLIEIKDDKERLALMRFLARKGKGYEVVDQLSLMTTLSDKDKKELADLLFTAKSFTEGYRVWTTVNASKPGEPVLFNGGFEEPLLLNDTGFGKWILAPAQTKNSLAIDPSENFAGTRSLRITLEGNWTPGTPLLSQTVMVEPSQTYRISFSVKTKDLVTGGPPMLVVNDATNDQLLGKSENFPATASWLKLNFDFTTLASSEAVVIRLQRNNCEPSPCPIFGVVWLDEISIEQVKQAARELKSTDSIR